MKQSDRDIIIRIVSNAFEQNPRAQAMMKKKNPARSVRLMTEYAYDLVEKFNGIYLSEDKTTVLFKYSVGWASTCLWVAQAGNQHGNYCAAGKR